MEQNNKPRRRKFSYNNEEVAVVRPAENQATPGNVLRASMPSQQEGVLEQDPYETKGFVTDVFDQVATAQRTREENKDMPNENELDREEKRPRKSNRDQGDKRKPKTGLIILLVVLTVLIVVGAVAAIFVSGEMGNKRKVDVGEVVIELPENGTGSTDEVAQILYNSGVIRYPFLFKVYSRVTGADGTYQLGSHTMRGDMSYAEIVEELQKTTIKPLETVTMTFPEGWTSLKMAIALEEKGLCTVEEFIDACNNDTFEVSFFSEITDNDLKFIKLEGFLYPDTYEFEVGITVHDIILKMLQNFETKVLTDDIKAALADSKYTLEEIVILASIVEKESFGGEEKNVSSVFNNRLQPDSPVGYLESDTTWNFIYYVLDYYYEGKENVPEGMRDAYNSYYTEGLIVGAICNPGVAMIDASLNPNDTPYYFFVTDVNKKYYWGRTADEHDANCDEAERVNREAERNGTAA